MDKNKLVLAFAVLLGFIVLAGAFYATETNKQKSIEKQQLLKIEEDRKIAEAKAEQDKKDSEAKAEQGEKEFDAKRKADCLTIYKTESDKWNNVRGWRYEDMDNECYIRYKEPSPKSAAKCDEIYPQTLSNGEPSFLFWRKNDLCKSGEFENLF